MERLQDAIHRARLQRNSTAEAAAPDAAPNMAAAGAATARLPGSGGWAALQPLVRTKTPSRRRFMPATEGGPQAAPFDMLRTRLTQTAPAQGWKRIAVVSAQAGAGKSTITANLAFALSRQDDLRTIALDLDLRRPHLAQTIGAELPENGMEEVLRGQVPFAQQARCLNGNLAFGLNAKTAHRTSELLQSQQTADTLSRIEAEFAPNFLLVDLPPVFGSDDTLGFLRQVDAALIVAEAEKTPIKQIDTVEKQVAEVTNVLGIVLNKCRYDESVYGYSYGYY
ncbi:CpsD/CapB family tyrosine-protein kinase [Frigidibacter sp. MR17.14]|uniref:CpsD/CapB family tyrosine-protein kinase n=1 Tax=Frigidibacter sp. MR17.14 TaxID=3126509 RepID=UPI003012FB2C